MNASEMSQARKKENIIKSMHTFLKNHKRLTIAIVAALAASIVCIVIVTIIHSAQAKEMTQAQIGRCYIASSGSSTEIHYFQENGCALFYVGYEDETRQRVTYVSGSLSEIYCEYSFEISLFGTVHLDYLSYGLPVVFGENYQIVSHRMGEWKLISLEEAQAIEQQYKYHHILKEACDNTCNSAIGAEGFLERLNEKFKSASIPPSIADNGSYISAAQSLLSEFLKNPSSAIYNSKSVVETDSYGRAIVYLDVSAQNSFGGFVRSEYYICLQRVFGSRYTYNSMVFSVNSPNQLEYLKSANNWNEDPSKDEDTTPFEPGQPENEGTVEVNGLTLHRYVFKSTKATYIAYIEPATQYVIAAEISIDKDTLGIYGLASAISGTMTATHDYVSPQYDKVFDCDSGIISTTPFFNDNCGCMYHAIEKNGKYYISVTNIEALGCTKTNYWSPIE